jgi:CTP-dependent riboflavin kinase
VKVTKKEREKEKLLERDLGKEQVMMKVKEKGRMIVTEKVMAKETGMVEMEMEKAMEKGKEHMVTGMGMGMD